MPTATESQQLELSRLIKHKSLRAKAETPEQKLTDFYQQQSHVNQPLSYARI